MNFLKKLFSKKDPFEKRAHDLALISKTIAKGHWLALSERYNFIYNFSDSDWDFFVTVAKVTMATSQLSGKIDKEREIYLLDIILAELRKWHCSSEGALNDCQDFMIRNMERLKSLGENNPDVLWYSSIGTWIAWNLLKRKPESRDECEFVMLIGKMVIDYANGYWEAK